MAIYLSVMVLYKKVYLLCFLLWIPFCGSLEGQNVCKRFKKARDASNREVDIIEFFCCAGYKAAKNRCVECTDCTHIDCPIGFCGEGCVKQCDCLNNAHCHPQQCCVCNKGFTGHSCDTPCAEGYYGQDCVHTCLCSNHSTCDRFTGRCLCDEGWTGYTCAEVTEAHTNVTCSPSCNCQDPRCSINGSDCQCHLRNSTTIDHALASDAETRPKSTTIFSFILITIIVLGLLIVIVAFISIVIFISRNGRKKYRVVEATTSDATGHYDEINPYDEIPEEQLEQLECIREPYYSTHLDVVKLKRTHSLPYIKPNRIRDEHIVPEIRYPNGSPKMHKYLSLPNLCNTDIMKAPYTELNVLKEVRHYNQLKHHSHHPTGSGYLHPYNRLLRPGIIGSGYLHPYSVLKKDSENIRTSFDSIIGVQRSVSGYNTSYTSVYRPRSGDNRSDTIVNTPVSGDNKSDTIVYTPVSGDNSSDTPADGQVSGDNKSETWVNGPVSGNSESNTSIIRAVSGENTSDTFVYTAVSGDNESVKRPISDDNKTNNVIQ